MAEGSSHVMTRRSHSVVALLLLSITSVALLGSNRRHQRQRASGQPGVFDYYVLALSWSPEFCHSHPERPECASGSHGFVVHGLWPQYVDGYPENCSTAPGLADPSRMTDIMPDTSLVAHEWGTHGTCSGLNPEEYFKLVRQAFESVKVPERLKKPHRLFSITPRELKQEFVRANPQWKADDVTVSCGNNYLTGVSVCMDKQLHAYACSGLGDC